MDYSGFQDFPFPSKLPEEANRAKQFFCSLPDEEQLQLLNGSTSYEEFLGRVQARRRTSNTQLLY